LKLCYYELVINKQKIILASGSKSRQTLLSALGYSFEVVISDFNEGKIKESDPSKRAAILASSKGITVAKNYNGIIIAGDTYSVCENKVLEKPKSTKEAKEMLSQLSGNKAIGYTGFYYIDKQNGVEVSETVETEVTFRNIYKEEINEYVETFPVTTWAAAIAPSEVYVLGLIKSIKGSLTGWAYGLPSELFVPLLAQSEHYPKP